MTDSRPTRKRRWQFSLFSLLIAITVACCISAYPKFFAGWWALVLGVLIALVFFVIFFPSITRFLDHFHHDNDAR